MSTPATHITINVTTDAGTGVSAERIANRLINNAFEAVEEGSSKHCVKIERMLDTDAGKGWVVERITHVRLNVIVSVCYRKN